jgi:hypothetical protein
MKYTIAQACLLGLISAVKLSENEYPQPDIRGPMPRNAHPDSTFSSHLHNDWTVVQTDAKEYPQPDIRGPMPRNAHPDSTFSSHLHNDWTVLQTDAKEYPQPDIRGPMPRNAHPDSTFSSHLHNDWTVVQTDAKEYPQPDIRGPMPRNAHPDSTFSSHLHNDWTLAQLEVEDEVDEDDDMEDEVEENEDELMEVPEDDENLQLDRFEHFVPNFDGADAAKGYYREVPEEFTEERDDRLMNSLIKTYALEMKDDSGRPSGHFFFDRDAARAVSNEVVHTHFKYNDNQSSEYLDAHFVETWDHFDVNQDNLIEVERMPQFLRWFLGNSLTIDLQ